MKHSRILVTAGMVLMTAYMPNAFSQMPDAMPTQERALFKALDLTDVQKQDIAEILRQTKQDNSIYKGEKQALRQQMRALMSAEVWDQALAEDLISQQVSQSTDLSLNRAAARHQAFNVLTSEQQVAFLEQRGERAGKKVKGKRGKHNEQANITRMQKRLGLSEQQILAFEQIQVQHQADTQALKASLKEAKTTENTLVYASEFDQQAWSELHQDVEQNKIAFGVERLHFRYQVLTILNDEQKQKFAKMQRKMREGKGSRKGKRESKRESQTNA